MVSLNLLALIFDIQKRIFAVHHVVVASIATMIVVVEVDIVATVAGMTIAIAALLATTIVNVAPTDVVMTTALAESTDTPLVVAMTATAAVEMTIVVVVNPTVEMVDALQLMGMLLQETLGTPMEVETKTSVLTIGTLVDRLRSANLLRCGALCQITRPNLPAILAYLRIRRSGIWRRIFFKFATVL